MVVTGLEASIARVVSHGFAKTTFSPTIPRTFTFARDMLKNVLITSSMPRIEGTKSGTSRHIIDIAFLDSLDFMD